MDALFDKSQLQSSLATTSLFQSDQLEPLNPQGIWPLLQIAQMCDSSFSKEQDGKRRKILEPLPPCSFEVLYNSIKALDYFNASKQVRSEQRRLPAMNVEGPKRVKGQIYLVKGMRKRWNGKRFTRCCIRFNCPKLAQGATQLCKAHGRHTRHSVVENGTSTLVPHQLANTFDETYERGKELKVDTDSK